MKTCIYCNREKGESEFSNEHILPRTIGGAIHPINPFATDLVCGRCNNIAGLFIDAPFAKSWFINNYRADNAKRYIKLTPSSILPLVYIGIVDELKFKGKICEFYLGPTGDLIYHFHYPYPMEMDTPSMVGVPPHLRNKGIDYGFAFIFLTTNNKEWLLPIFNSFMDHFEKSILYFGNGPTPKGGRFSDIPAELNELLVKIRSMNGKEHTSNVTMDIDTGNRFMAKLALGLGCLFLKGEYKTSTDAELLRKLIWTRDAKERQKLPVHGTGFLSGTDTLKDLNEKMKWEGGHILFLTHAEESLALYANFYGQGGSLIQVTENKNHWSGVFERAIIYIIIPERQKCVGPIHFEDYIRHKFSNYKNQQLTELEEDLKSVGALPPFRLSEGGFYELGQK
jgi:hypothetical protein